MLPRTSVEVGYHRRWFQGFTVTDNLVVDPTDYSQYSVTAPADPRLPGGGGNTISGLYDVDPALFEGSATILRMQGTMVSRNYTTGTEWISTSARGRGTG